MKVFTVDFKGHYLGGIAVIVASTRPQAAAKLEAALLARGLEQMIDPKDLEQIATTKSDVHILFDGNY